MREFDEDEYDVDKKAVAADMIKSNREKKILMVMTFALTSIWLFYGRFEI